MTRLIRWGHLVDGRISVLWAASGQLRTSIVDGITLERIDGEPLSNHVDGCICDDMLEIEHGGASVYGYRGVLEPAASALA